MAELFGLDVRTVNYSNNWDSAPLPYSFGLCEPRTENMHITIPTNRTLQA